MSQVYLPAVSVEAGLAQSAALWNLMRPAPQAGEVTQYLYPVIQDANGNAWAIIDPTMVINVPAGSTGAELVSVFQAAVAAGRLTSGDVTWTQAQIVASAGKSVPVSTFLPADVLAQQLTYDQMVAAGNIVVASMP